MSRSDDRFATVTAADSVFAAKAALDPLAAFDAIHAREAQERALATILAGVDEGSLPATVSIYGPRGRARC